MHTKELEWSQTGIADACTSPLDAVGLCPSLWLWPAFSFLRLLLVCLFLLAGRMALPRRLPCNLRSHEKGPADTARLRDSMQFATRPQARAHFGVASRHPCSQSSMAKGRRPRVFAFPRRRAEGSARCTDHRCRSGRTRARDGRPNVLGASRMPAFSRHGPRRAKHGAHSRQDYSSYFLLECQNASDYGPHSIKSRKQQIHDQLG